jgi:hypothetical protein
MRGIIVPLLFLAACGPAASAPAPASAPMRATAATAPSLAGTYALRQINGHALPAASPQEPNVEVTGGALQLGGDGTVRLALTGRRNQEPTPGTQEMSGTYTVTGNVLAFTFNGQPHPPFTYTRAGSTLVLRDEQGNLWLMDRQ